MRSRLRRSGVTCDARDQISYSGRTTWRMHPVFDPTQLDKLPLALRTRAKRLFNASGPDLDSLPPTPAFARSELEGFGKLLPQNYPVMVPVYWKILAPSRLALAMDHIQELERPAEMSPRIAFLLQSTCIALYGLFRAAPTPELPSSLPPEALFELWDRLHPWVQFLQAHFTFLPPSCLLGYSETELLMFFMVFSAKTFPEENHLPKWHRTPGMMFLVFRAWRLILAEPPSESILIDYLPFLAFMLPQMRLTPEALDDIISGSGGTLDAVAQSFATHISLICERLAVAPPRLGISFTLESDLASLGQVRPPLEALIDIVGHLWPDDDTVSFPRLLARHLPMSVISNGFALLAVMSISVGATPVASPDSALALERAVHALNGVLRFLIPLDRTHLADVLDGGYLRSFAACCQRHHEFTTVMGPDIEWMIREILQPCTMFSATNERLLVGLAAAQEFTSTSAFRGAPFIKDWDLFVEMAHAHARAFASTAVFTRYGACSNISCGRIDLKSKFRVCSTCRSQLYCGTDCQKEDWLAGKHRKTCSKYRDARHSLRKTFTPRELHDIRTVITMHSQGAALRTTYSTFTFRGPCMALSIDLAAWEGRRKATRGPQLRTIRYRDADHQPLDGNLGNAMPTWGDWKARAEVDGRIALHLVRLRLGGKQYFWVMPMRSNSAMAKEKGREIWERIGKDAKWSEFEREWEVVDLPEDYIQVYC
ncbi:MYND-type domain-containing protein [Mycena chlorophos]|uniref:MYND-type domain-containing protein n=1 Tax=Mycena chlorophos TaxID=658473 RepID=A0A8H6WAT4_MYCCL|nr:MYND-type domain-containing protein [Mycena chlorophos]